MAALEKNDGMSILTADTVIDGDITSTSPLKICGEVKGNVTGTKKVEVSGRVTGFIAGESVVLSGANVEGNVTSKTSLDIYENTFVVGDVKAEDLSSSGKIKGNIEVAKLISLDETAVCEGSISASLINIKTGAKIKGPITIFEMGDTEFDEKKNKRAKAENVAVV